MIFQKQIIILFVTLLLLNLVHSQSSKKEELVLIPGPVTSEYKKNDLNEEYDEGVEILCAGRTCISSNSNKVSIKKGEVTIINDGTFIFSGDLNGSLNIDVKEDDTVHLVLRNATISSNYGPAISSKKLKKLIVTLEGESSVSDTKNYPGSPFTDEETTEEATEDVTEEAYEYDEEDDGNEEEETKYPTACIFIKGNLTFNGKGSLDVKANFDEGIRSKKNLKLVSGKINVVSVGHGIKAKKSICIKDGITNVEAGKSGIKATQDDDPEEGYIVIDGGITTVKAGNDGIHAETHLTINDGVVKVLESREGIEGQMIDILGGDILINTSDDGMNAGKIGSKQPSSNNNRPNFNFNFNFTNFNFGRRNRTTTTKKTTERVELTFTESFDEPTEYFELPTELEEPSEAFEEPTEVIAMPIEEFEEPSEAIESQTEVIEDQTEAVENQTEVIEDQADELEEPTSIIDEEITEVVVEVPTEANEEPTYGFEIRTEYIEDHAVIVEVPTEVEEEPTDAFENPTNVYELPTELEEPTDLEEPIEVIEEPKKSDEEDPIAKRLRKIEKYKQIYINIVGGKVDVMADGPDIDGIDSNGVLYIGGNAEVYSDARYGGTFGHEAAIDSDGPKAIDVGTKLLVTGSGRMPEGGKIKGQKDADGVYDDPTLVFCVQPYIRVVFDLQEEFTPVIIKNSEGKVLAERQPRTKFAIVYFTSPELFLGETYTVLVGDTVVKTATPKVDDYEQVENMRKAIAKAEE